MYHTRVPAAANSSGVPGHSTGRDNNQYEHDDNDDLAARVPHNF